MHQASLKYFSSTASRAVIFCVILIAIFATGCGGGGDTIVAPPTPTPQGTAVQVRMGDAALDRVLFFAFKVGSPLTMTTTGGQKILYDIGNNRWELTHMAGKLEPLSMAELLQGSYSSLDLVVVSPGMVYLDNNGVPQGLLGNPSQNVTVNFAPPLTVGATPFILNMDVNVANALAVDANGFVTGFDFKSSTFTFTTKAIAAVADQQDDSGEIEGTNGVVTAVTGSNFTLEVGQGNTELVFATDSSTKLEGGLTTLASAVNQIVKVEGYSRSDGSLFAKELEAMESQSGATLEGLITNLIASPVGFQLEVQDGNGNGMDPSKVGALVNVDMSNLTAGDFIVDWGKCDTGGLVGAPFVFDSAHLHIGQRVEVETVNSVPALFTSTPIVANKIRLQQQAFVGTVSNYTAGQGGAAQFDLNLPTDGSSYMALLLDSTVIHVYLQPGTNNTFGAIANGSKLRVRGSLFVTFTPGPTYNMVARRITP